MCLQYSLKEVLQPNNKYDQGRVSTQETSVKQIIQETED